MIDILVALLKVVYDLLMIVYSGSMMFFSFVWLTGGWVKFGGFKDEDDTVIEFEFAPWLKNLWRRDAKESKEG